MRSLSGIAKSLLITESISNKDFDRALNVIDSYLNKYQIYSVPFDQPILMKHSFIGANLWSPDRNIAACVLWRQSISSTQIDAVAFFDDVNEWFYVCQEGGNLDANVVVQSKGASTARVVELIKDVMLGNIKLDKSTIEKEIAKYQLYESKVFGSSNFIFEETLDDLDKEAKQLRRKIRKYEVGSEEWNTLQGQLDDIKRRKNLLKGGVKSTVKVTVEAPLLSKEEKKFEEELQNWQERFEDMEAYVQMVIDGIKPLCVICGTAGVGKTYRTTKMAEMSGKKISKGGYKAIGENCALLKGSQTTVSLYQNLFQYKEDGDLIIFDDCDSILKDIDSINLLKAATDSSDERIVAYGTSRPPEVPEQLMELHPEWESVCIQDSKGRWHYPQAFEFKGSIIILTNMRSGQIDTAIKNRAIMADLDFNDKTMLDIIKTLAPEIQPKKLTMEAKQMAIKFLERMAEEGADIQISPRSFETCAGFFVRCKDPKAAERRVREQMKCLYAKGGKRY